MYEGPYIQVLQGEKRGRKYLSWYLKAYKGMFLAVFVPQAPWISEQLRMLFGCACVAGGGIGKVDFEATLQCNWEPASV